MLLRCYPHSLPTTEMTELVDGEDGSRQYDNASNAADDDDDDHRSSRRRIGGADNYNPDVGRRNHQHHQQMGNSDGKFHNRGLGASAPSSLHSANVGHNDDGDGGSGDGVAAEPVKLSSKAIKYIYELQTERAAIDSNAFPNAEQLLDEGILNIFVLGTVAYNRWLMFYYENAAKSEQSFE